MAEIRLIRAPDPPPSPARTRPPSRPPFRIAAVQHRWHADPDAHEAGAAEPEGLPGGRTFDFAARLARETGAHVHASLYERSDGNDGLGFNTAIVVSPTGDLVARTRKLHIPVTAGYHEDRY